MTIRQQYLNELIAGLEREREAGMRSLIRIEHLITEAKDKLNGTVPGSDSTTSTTEP